MAWPCPPTTRRSAQHPIAAARVPSLIHLKFISGTRNAAHRTTRRRRHSRPLSRLCRPSAGHLAARLRESQGRDPRNHSRAKILGGTRRLHDSIKSDLYRVSACRIVAGASTLCLEPARSLRRGPARGSLGSALVGSHVPSASPMSTSSSPPPSSSSPSPRPFFPRPLPRPPGRARPPPPPAAPPRLGARPPRRPPRPLPAVVPPPESSPPPSAPSAPSPPCGRAADETQCPRHRVVRRAHRRGGVRDQQLRRLERRRLARRAGSATLGGLRAARRCARAPIPTGDSPLQQTHGGLEARTRDRAQASKLARKP